MESEQLRDWPGTFERDTLVAELGVLTRRLLRPALAARAAMAMEADNDGGRALLEVDVSNDARLAVHHVEADRYVVHLQHPEFEIVVQAVCEPPKTLEALRVASLSGDAMAALVWCRVLLQPHGRLPGAADGHREDPETSLDYD